jgi:hypothetical protein
MRPKTALCNAVALCKTPRRSDARRHSQHAFSAQIKPDEGLHRATWSLVQGRR